MKNDLRDWISKADAMGELKRVQDANWRLEIGCLTHLSMKTWGRSHPALLFDQIADYPAGYQVLTCPVSNRARIAMTMNLDPCASDQKFVELLARKFQEWEDASGGFRPIAVASGPVQEEVHVGDDVNILEFPAPWGNEMDGGRYIGTGDMVITRDPDTGEVNLGTYRVMLHDEKTTGLFISHGQHGNIHIQKWHERGQAAPVAISLGHHPALFLASCTELPLGIEYQFAGAIMGGPVEVVIEEETGLPIPAQSEAVLVGWCPPGKKHAEGPFAEWTGYYASGQEPAPIVEVKRIYHRRNPILMSCVHKVPPHDISYFSALRRSALLYYELVKNGVPDVKGTWVSEIGGRQLMVVSIKQRFAGHSKQAGMLASQNRAGGHMGRYVIVVDDDIDPSNIQEVLWALCTRSDPEQDIDIIRHCRSSSLDPMLEKPQPVYVNSRAIIDACVPFARRNTFPKAVRFSTSYEAEVAQKWQSFFGEGGKVSPLNAGF